MSLHRLLKKPEVLLIAPPHMDVRPLQEVVAYGYQRFVVSRLRHRDMKIPVDVKKELDVMLLQGDTGGLQPPWR